MILPFGETKKKRKLYILRFFRNKIQKVETCNINVKLTHTREYNEGLNSAPLKSTL